ncbi:hypothetical protein Desti_3969 [Desulfomonile tiedjei DSM 6799]|uniref:Uncharacterized protein n=1 Tax=Desulfomonile tiedjei (strain ATCC 49306 / DSM 6799 / DCB-1) TaxID=706587 RepID=I4CAM0_DESTA|nr:hypothetical protein Desti_3969 [Desulfomonile tiedjei DSM 6799]
MAFFILGGAHSGSRDPKLSTGFAPVAKSTAVWIP